MRLCLAYESNGQRTRTDSLIKHFDCRRPADAYPHYAVSGRLRVESDGEPICLRGRLANFNR